MIKIIDVDKLFDEYISDYVYKNIGKVKPEEIENKIPELYVEFGDKKLKELDGMTPNSYYKSFGGKELLDCLKRHLDEDVSVSDFLCEAIADGKKNEDELINGLNDEDNEEFTIYILNMLNEMGSEKCFEKYIEYVMFDYSVTIKELATEHLKENAEKVKEKILFHFEDASDEAKEYFSEILSNTKNDERVYNLLVKQFKENKSKMSIYASYLVKYGDDKAVEVLKEAIEEEKISYADFQELRFSIEALGGEYTKERDFSHDELYKKIKGYKPNTTILGSKK